MLSVIICYYPLDQLQLPPLWCINRCNTSIICVKLQQLSITSSTVVADGSAFCPFQL